LAEFDSKNREIVIRKAKTGKKRSKMLLCSDKVDSRILILKGPLVLA
jgi:hypothetical protein